VFVFVVVMKKSIILAIFIVAFMGVVTANSETDYVGLMQYMPGYNYSVFLNSTAENVVFSGVTPLTGGASYVFDYDSSNVGYNRINHVWFRSDVSGVLGGTNEGIGPQLRVDQFVRNGFEWFGSASDLGGGIYEGSVDITAIPFSHVPQSLTLSVFFDLNNRIASGSVVGLPYSFETSLDDDWDAGIFAFGSEFLEIRIDLLEGEPAVILSELVGVEPSWWIDMTPVTLKY
jgi:hypothetical protein